MKRLTPKQCCPNCHARWLRYKAFSEVEPLNGNEDVGDFIINWDDDSDIFDRYWREFQLDTVEDEG